MKEIGNYFVAIADKTLEDIFEIEDYIFEEKDETWNSRLRNSIESKLQDFIFWERVGWSCDKNLDPFIITESKPFIYKNEMGFGIFFGKDTISREEFDYLVLRTKKYFEKCSTDTKFVSASIVEVIQTEKVHLMIEED